MQLHHDKHHQAYVTGANSTLDQLAEARRTGSLDAINGLQKSLAFHLGGHLNHSLFWRNMSPDGGDRPDGDLADAIAEHLGSFESFRAHFAAVALQLQGSGWSVLAWESLGQRMVIEQLYDQQGNLPVGTVPLLMLDMWEHAYYLDYQATKTDYVSAWWNVVNWVEVAQRLEVARTQTPGLFVP